MQKINAAAEPVSMLTLRQQGARYAELASEPSIRRSLWEQQGKRCAYCERVLADPSSPVHNTRIEHFHPQGSHDWASECERASHAASNGDAPVAWGNFLLCCDGNERAGQNFTCDKAKANIDICITFRNPRDWAVDQLVNVERDGRVVAMPGLPVGADAVIDDVLNLNAEHLIAARKVVLVALKRQISAREAKRHGLTAQQKAAMAESLRRDAKVREYGACFLAVAARLG
ncbi:hypothetical protein [Curtobacterium sp. MCLR17_034]|uniref:hypothetical protein n=1 Tax=Curtobacterium sp. MCLR17_034 TaxID=2175623 RepID=UPI0011B855C4|nr:hypothetical protein [Curtobacterium sp. MCLR17_034]